MQCQCQDSEIDYFSLQNQNPGQCDSRDYVRVGHEGQATGLNVFENQYVKSPFESCLEANFYRAPYEYNWMHENATISLDYKSTYVRCEYASLSICQAPITSKSYLWIDNNILKNWVNQEDIQDRYQTTISFQSPVFLRFIFTAWQIEELMVSEQTVTDFEGNPWQSVGMSGIKPITHILPYPIVGQDFAIKLAKNVDQFITKLSFGGCEEGKGVVLILSC